MEVLIAIIILHPAIQYYVSKVAIPQTLKQYQEMQKSENVVDCDYNNDGIVDFKDLAILAQHWLEKK